MSGSIKPEKDKMGELDGFFPGLDEKELEEGEMKLVRIEGTPVLFVKQSGRVFVIDNRCPHLGCGFSGGSLDGLVIVCPCHDWRFSLETGEYEEEPSLKLVTYEWKIWEGKIWIKFDE